MGKNIRERNTVRFDQYQFISAASFRGLIWEPGITHETADAVVGVATQAHHTPTHKSLFAAARAPLTTTSRAHTPIELLR